MAMDAPAVKLAYVAMVNGNNNGRHDAIGVVDVDPGSSGCGNLVGQVDMPNAGDELHHFGWNACMPVPARSKPPCGTPLSRSAGHPLVAHPRHRYQAGFEAAASNWRTSRSLGLCYTPQVRFRVEREILSRLREFETFDEFVVAQNQICFASAPAHRNIFDSLTSKNKSFCVVVHLLHVGVDEALLVELPEYELFSSAVISDHPQIVVDFAVLVLLLRRICGRVLYLKEPTIENELIFSLRCALAGLAGLIATPTAHEEL
jgi:hypothetical protein